VHRNTAGITPFGNLVNRTSPLFFSVSAFQILKARLLLGSRYGSVLQGDDSSALSCPPSSAEIPGIPRFS